MRQSTALLDNVGLGEMVHGDSLTVAGKRSSARYEAFEQIVKGPVWDGNLISKSERDTLQGHGLIDRGYGWNFLTAKGVEVAVALGFLKP